MNDQRNTRLPQFFLTPGGPCPYLPGRVERKVFARLSGLLARPLNDALTQSGFRRSQMVAYRPACEGCNACVSVRIVVADFAATRNQRRILKRNGDLLRREMPAEATREQFALLRTYLDARHAGGGMSDMGLFDYVAMVEETPVDTHIVEYRKAARDGTPGPLMACALSDVLRDGLSMVYSFYHPGEEARSLGTQMILDHVASARTRGLPYVYLGYWIDGSEKMDYKSRFRPLEALGPDGWVRLKA
ncbi:MAG: arginyltransferase [Alphaproteobacteria bacterium]|nr:arginyltransferase [Alphaproteobacteria bacterium]MDE2012497.1 arginyltransferase [Alphaproteobacteria bacterium]MDE2072795.1 arginyltransferase [Alphaproteobacteria bacterium]MDE2352386.1 arginyltransferase [Alphaproteobacteria bacterium]